MKPKKPIDMWSFCVGAFAATGVFALLAAAGCVDSDGRQKISGKVTLDGQPLPSGEISLRPVETGPSAAGQIVDGKFVLSRDKGPPPGKYLVHIESFQPTGRKVAMPDSPDVKVDEMREVVPPKYNQNSELTVEVESGGPNEFEFQLKSR